MDCRRNLMSLFTPPPAAVSVMARTHAHAAEGDLTAEHQAGCAAGGSVLKPRGCLSMWRCLFPPGGVHEVSVGDQLLPHGGPDRPSWWHAWTASPLQVWQ